MTDEIVSQAMKQAAHETPVLFYSPGIDPFLENLTKGAAFCFENESPDIPKLFAPLNHKIKNQATMISNLININPINGSCRNVVQSTPDVP